MRIQPATVLLLLTSSACHAFQIHHHHHHHKTTAWSLQATVTASDTCQLAQLARMTTLSIDSGDFNVIRDYASTGLITDATTNPLFVSQAGLSGDPVYSKLVDDAVQAAIDANLDNHDATIAHAIDGLAVNLGATIATLVPGYISTEVDPRLSFDTIASIERGKRIIDMYAALDIPKERVLIKLAATWEGIMAAQTLEQLGIQCNLTLVFSVVQAIACAQRGAHLISPFPGRILDWYKVAQKRTDGVPPEQDEGVVAVKAMYHYYKKFGHDTICMPASWRPSRGAGFDLDEIRALAGTDRMTIPATLLAQLAESEEPLMRQLDVESAKAADLSMNMELVGDGMMDEKEFRYRMNMDGCGNDKLAEGLRAFIGETEKLEKVIAAKINSLSA